MQKTIYPYVRFSSIEQQKGDSVRRQINAIRAYAKNNGYKLNEAMELQDLGLSAYKGSNHKSTDSGLGRFLEAIEQGGIPTDGSSYLCVEQLDRLSREQVLDALDLFKRILSKNVNIITLMDNRVYTKESLNDFMSLMYSLMIMHQAFLESEKKSERIKAAFQGRLEKIKNGGNAKYSSAIPNWLDEIEPKSGIFKENKHAETIRKIFTMVLHGYSLNEVARILNAENIPRITRNNYKNATGIWSGSIISHIIKNRCTLGHLDLYYRLKSTNEEKGKKTLVETIENYYPAIISETCFIIANEFVKERRLTHESGRKTNDNLFTGLLFCGDCLQRIHFETDVKKLKNFTKKYKCLKCTSKRFKKGCNAITIQYDEFEEGFPKLKYFETGARRENRRILRERKIKEIEAEAEVLKLTKLIKDLNNEILKNEDINISHFVNTLSNLERRLDTARMKSKETRLMATFEENRGREIEIQLFIESDRIKYKKYLKDRLACVIVYTHEKYAWIIDKNGGTIYFNFGNSNITSRENDFLEFVTRLNNKIENNETIDPHFYKIEKAIKKMHREEDYD